MLLPHMRSPTQTEGMDALGERRWNRVLSESSLALSKDMWDHTAVRGSGLALSKDTWDRTAAGESGLPHKNDLWNHTAAGGTGLGHRNDLWNHTAVSGSGLVLRKDMWDHTAAGGNGLTFGKNMWNHTAAGGSGPSLSKDTWDHDLATRTLTGGLLSLLILWTLLGNILVCVAVLRFRHLRSKVTHVFIVSLALSDLFVAVLVMPWKAVAEVTGHWPFGSFCDVWVAFDIMCSTASILNLCVISVDRYWAISTPFLYERKMTQRVALVMIGAAWTLSVLISFVPVQLNWHKAAEDMNQSHGAQENCDSSLSREYAISSSLISFYIPVAIMVVTYSRIYRIAQMQIRRIATLERAAEHAQSCRSNRLECEQHTSLKTSIRRETKVLKTLSIIMGVFVCCWMPFFILNCIVPFCEKPCVSETTFDVFVWFGWTNSSLNPVIYAFNADFRKAFASLLGCRYLCTSTAVETVNISNELVSFNHHTLIHREIASAYVDIIPNVVECLQEDGFDRISQFSHNSTDSACDREDPDIGLELFTPNGRSPFNGSASFNGHSAFTHNGRTAPDRASALNGPSFLTPNGLH